jgi:hypothetical protein
MSAIRDFATAQTRYRAGNWAVLCRACIAVAGRLAVKSSTRGKQMEEEVEAMRGILLGVLTGATVWFMVYVAMFL